MLCKHITNENLDKIKITKESSFLQRLLYVRGIIFSTVVYLAFDR